MIWISILFAVVACSQIAQAQSNDDSSRSFKEFARFNAIYGGGSLWGPIYKPSIRGSNTSLWLSYHGQENVGIRLSYNPTYFYSTRPDNYIQATGSFFEDDFDFDYSDIYSLTVKYLHPIKEFKKLHLSLEGGVSYVSAKIKEYAPRDIEYYPGSWFFRGGSSSNYYKSTKIVEALGIPVQVSLEYCGKIINYAVYMRAEVNEINSLVMYGGSFGLGFSK